MSKTKEEVKPKTKNRTMQDTETAQHIFRLSVRRNSWLTQEIFDAVYPGYQPKKTEEEIIEQVEALAVDFVSKREGKREADEAAVNNFMEHARKRDRPAGPTKDLAVNKALKVSEEHAQGIEENQVAHNLPEGFGEFNEKAPPDPTGPAHPVG